MKKTVKGCLAVLSLCALTSLANAAVPGSYAGLGLGWSKQEGSNPFPSQVGVNFSRKDQETGLGGRIFAGYNFDRNFGVEAGLAKYANASYEADSSLGNLSAYGKREFELQALDVVGKAYLPISNSGFNLYGLAGLALVHSTNKNSAGVVDNAKAIYTAKKNTTHNKIRPIYGLGASYDIPKTQLTSNLEFTRIQGYGNVKTSANAMPSANLVTLNLAYNFN